MIGLGISTGLTSPARLPVNLLGDVNPTTIAASWTAASVTLTDEGSAARMVTTGATGFPQVRLDGSLSSGAGTYTAQVDAVDPGPGKLYLRLTGTGIGGSASLINYEFTFSTEALVRFETEVTGATASAVHVLDLDGGSTYRIGITFTATTIDRYALYAIWNNATAGITRDFRRPYLHRRPALV